MAICKGWLSSSFSLGCKCWEYVLWGLSIQFLACIKYFIMPALRRWKQEVYQFRTSLSYTKWEHVSNKQINGIYYTYICIFKMWETGFMDKMANWKEMSHFFQLNNIRNQYHGDKHETIITERTEERRNIPEGWGFGKAM